MLLPMLTLTPQGLYCPAGDFFIDPKGRVRNAVVTHAHSDHARRGAERYFTAASGEGLLRCRLGKNIRVEPKAFGETFQLGLVKVSLHPAGTARRRRLENSLRYAMPSSR